MAVLINLIAGTFVGERRGSVLRSPAFSDLFRSQANEVTFHFAA
jgi:hypothetical protein